MKIVRITTHSGKIIRKSITANDKNKPAVMSLTNFLQSDEIFQIFLDAFFRILFVNIENVSINIVKMLFPVFLNIFSKKNYKLVVSPQFKVSIQISII